MKKRNKKKKRSVHKPANLSVGLQFHRKGDFHAAEKIYKNIIAKQPNHPDALHLLGLVAHQTGNHQSALELIGKAVRHHPESPVFHNSLGAVYQAVRQYDQAIQCYDRSAQLKPDYAEPFFNKGGVLQDQGKLTEAIGWYEKALRRKPDYPDALFSMGTAFQGLKEWDRSLDCFKRVLALIPSHANACFSMGCIHQDRGDGEAAMGWFQKALRFQLNSPYPFFKIGCAFYEEGKWETAASCFKDAIARRPDFAEAYNQLGRVLEQLHKYTLARESFQKALQCKPGFTDALYNLGNRFHIEGDLEQAFASFEKVLQLDPDYYRAHNNMGGVFHKLGKVESAIVCFRRATELAPDFAEAYYNLGNALQSMGELSQSIECYEKALSLKPDFTDAYSILVHLMQLSCNWAKLNLMGPGLDQMTDEAIAGRTRAAETPFMNISRWSDPERNMAVAASWSNAIRRHVGASPHAFSFDGRGAPNQKIKVGYLSNAFRNHPDAHLMSGLFGLHNRKHFEIFCYSYGPDDESDYRRRIAEECDHFIDLFRAGYARMADRIYSDKIDILVDLRGPTQGNDLAVAALQPAPVQVAFLGYPGTTGADFFDYVIADKVVAPTEHARYFSEKIVHMPHCYQINDHTQVISGKEWRKDELGLPENGFVFSSFNTSYKIESTMFDCWMRILAKVPQSVLWLLASNDTVVSNLKKEAEDRGVDSERLVFGEKMSKPDHLSRLKLADLVLDTRIYNGHTSTSDALWAGVPVVTLQGGHFASRVSSSILSAAGLSELITLSLEEYETLAVCLAGDRERTEAIRDELLHARHSSPLFDTPRFVRDLETAYRMMWEIYSGDQSPRSISVVDNTP